MDAHRALLERVAAPPRAVVASGIREGDLAELAAAYRSLGLGGARVRRAGGFVCLAMADP